MMAMGEARGVKHIGVALIGALGDLTCLKVSHAP